MTLLTMLRRSTASAPPPSSDYDDRFARLAILVEEQSALLAALSARVAALEAQQ